MTKDEQRDIVLNFFKERGQEIGKSDDSFYCSYFKNKGVIVLELNNKNYWRLSEISYEKEHDFNYDIKNLPTDHKELTVLLNILNPLNV